MIEVKNLCKRYGDHVAVDDLSFTIESGHVYGFLGPNGAGKSTTMNIITGCLAATSGSVTIDGYDIYEDAQEAKSRIGYLPEIPPLYQDMTVREYLMFVTKAKGVGHGAEWKESEEPQGTEAAETAATSEMSVEAASMSEVADAAEAPEEAGTHKKAHVKKSSAKKNARWASRQAIENQLAAAMAVTQLEDVENRLIKNLSKGYKQRVGIAQALLGGPEIIILDEPTVGLDPRQIIEIRDLIRELGREHTVILSSHILSEVRSICDRLLIIAGGKLVASDTPEHLEEQYAPMTFEEIFLELTGEMSVEQVERIALGEATKNVAEPTEPVKVAEPEQATAEEATEPVQPVVEAAAEPEVEAAEEAITEIAEAAAETVVAEAAQPEVAVAVETPETAEPAQAAVAEEEKEEVVENESNI